MAKWTQKEIDQAYNLHALIGGVMGLSWSWYSRDKGVARVVLDFFAGVGLGGTFTYGYLYNQGVYDNLYK